MKYSYQIVNKETNVSVYTSSLPLDTWEQAKTAGDDKRRLLMLSAVNYEIKVIPLKEMVEA